MEIRGMRISTLIVTMFLIGAGPASAEDAGTITPNAPPAATANAKAAHLDELFAGLKAASTRDEGKAIERQIVGEWLESGDPKIDDLMVGAIFAMSRGMFPVALDYLDKVVAARPDYVEGWNKRATVYYEQKRYDESLADIARTLAIEPRHFGALAGLGMIMVDKGDKQAAIKAFERALEVDPALDNAKNAIEVLKDLIGKEI